MKEIILIKNGELALKGLNRASFEDKLIKNIKTSLYGLGSIKIKKAQSTITIEPEDENYPYDQALERVSKVFGIAAFSRAAVCQKDMDDILSRGVDWVLDKLKDAKTFKVESKRADKRFAMTSPEISRQVGGKILSKCPHLKVDVHNPDVTVVVEIRDYAAYIRAGQEQGAGGMPVGTSGRGAILISGGIDSPVAAYMMAKRGIELFAVHFASPPYTGPLAEKKVKDLLRQVTKYSGQISLAIVPFTEIQMQIGQKCEEQYFTLIMRRFMMKIASRLAVKNNCDCLITGESLAQVASQTTKALSVTDDASEMVVLRPLIGMDKEEIIKISRKIDTFDISVLPYEDCCTVFTPRHPKTKPEIIKVIEAEKELDIEALIEDAVNNTHFELIK